MNLKVFAAFVLTLACSAVAHARLGETIAQIEVRYGKPIKGSDPIKPAVIAGCYMKAGYGIVIGFMNGKSCYEVFAKV